MPRSVARLFGKSAKSRGGKSSEWVDWVVSALLVIAIIIVAVWVCMNPNRDSTDEEGFWANPSNHDFSDESEPFASGGKHATPVRSLSDLDAIGPQDLGVMLVYYNQCGHCQTYKPVWKNICNQVNGQTIAGKRVKMYECGDDHDPDVWQQVSNRFGIRGYPTIMVNIGGGNAKWTEYTGSRNALADYLKSLNK